MSISWNEIKTRAASFVNEWKEQDQVNIEAAELMGKLHDRLKEIGYTGHQLEVYLVRLLFCLFADDTGIFEHDLFIKYIIVRTNIDGSDLALHLQMIFEVLNKPTDKRLKTLDEQLNKFPYVDGELFEELLETAAFDSKMRESLIECCSLDWSKISPAIFGSIFQSVMNAEERRNLGAHYTSEENILKVIHPLFLDDLWNEFDKYNGYKSDARIARLNEFHDKLARLKFLDPACGCGNFLVITYREIRLLEMAVIKELLAGERLLNVDLYIKVNVNRFYGIEIKEFPCKVAQVAMWLIDHQMNMLIRDMFGQYFIRIPLQTSASIVWTNSLRTDWESVVPKKELSYILGNPPFVGFTYMNPEQKEDMQLTFKGHKNTGVLDYVTAWYKKAAEFIQGTEIEVAFVSTNSICQGEVVAPLWSLLFDVYHIKINFAHQTFKWSNEAKGKAAVFCIIVGFGLKDRKKKKIFHYATITGDPVELKVKQINAYLVDAPNIMVVSRNKPLENVPPMIYGNKPVDGGNLIIEENDYETFISKEPGAKPYIRKLLGAKEFINNLNRYCLWLVDVNPKELKKLPLVMERIQKCKEMRANSIDAGARKLALTPSTFRDTNNPDTAILIPRVSSERRNYIPVGFIDKTIIVNDAVQLIPNGSLFEFGIVMSSMHMAWMRYICGRLKSDYRYSKDIVYNNFPWPKPTEKQKENIEQAARAVLDARGMFPDSSLADLYDPDTMPPVLVKAHTKLDKLVEKAYEKSFANDADRVTFLFEKYQDLTIPERK